MASRESRLAAAACAAVVALDLAQLGWVPWRASHWGAVGGAALYASLAVALVVGRGSRVARWVTAAMPLVPASVFTLHHLGAIAAAPSPWMVPVGVVQLVAAAAAGTAEWRSRAEAQ